MYVCMYVCMHVCMYTHIHIHIYTLIYTFLGADSIHGDTQVILSKTTKIQEKVAGRRRALPATYSCLSLVLKHIFSAGSGLHCSTRFAIKTMR